MKRIKTVNGYTIYQAATQRDADNYNCEIGNYNIYIAQDIRDYGLQNSYPEWENEDSLAVAVARCNGSQYAVAVALADELSDSTAQDMDLVLEIERRLEAGQSLEQVRLDLDPYILNEDDQGEIETGDYLLDSFGSIVRVTATRGGRISIEYPSGRRSHNWPISTLTACSIKVVKATSPRELRESAWSAWTELGGHDCDLLNDDTSCKPHEVFRAVFDDEVIMAWEAPQTWRHVFSAFKYAGTEYGHGKLYCSGKLIRETGRIPT